MDLSPGAVIAGRYRADQRVGMGGMGEVWAGEQLAIGIKVALKTLLPAASVSHEVVARFKREAYLLARIRSGHVARVLDFVNDEQYGLVLVMEFIEGEPLSKLLYRRMAVEDAVELGADIAAALCDLHRVHIVHRDLKPGNIIMQPTQEGRKRAVLVDFGVSRLVSGGDEETITAITRANMAVGTVEYMAPEQILNSRDVTGASDLYALGAILFRAVACRHVYGMVSENELAHTKLTQDAPSLETGRTDRLARSFEDVVARALRRRTAERYTRAEEMLLELAALRDLARIAAFDLEGTTTEARGSAAAVSFSEPDEEEASVTSKRELGAHASELPPDGGVAQPPAVSTPSFSATPTTPAGERSVTTKLVRPKRAIPVGLVAAAIVTAMLTGIGAGVALTRRGSGVETADAAASAVPDGPGAPTTATTSTPVNAPSPAALIDPGDVASPPPDPIRVGPTAGKLVPPPPDPASKQGEGARSAKPILPSGPPVEKIDF